ncbi:MAG TPA: NAD-dependent succinate-semialdehyde dehydrogenase [Stenotrophobium sp.]|nr:NAD-dependent succinate-semialdehyde dehydrogenase [Stenotrophobium sp.]
MHFETINPASGEVLQRYDAMDAAQLERSSARCHRAQQDWATRTFAERATCMQAASAVLLRHRQRYARQMALEMGKPLAQALAEIEKCARVCDYYAEHAARFLAPQPVASEAHSSAVHFNPLGVVLAVMPWNYPWWQVFRFAAPGLMAGNGALLKHAPSVFGCALMIEEAFDEAGFPPGLFSSLLLDVGQTGAVIRDPRVAAVTITASVAAGRAVAAEAGKALKKCVLELGGSDPYIVLEDADLDRAVEVGVDARYQNTGQSCIAAKRFILVEAIRAEFERKFVERVRRLRMGDPFADNVDLGPMSRRELRDGLHQQVRRSVDAGAELLCGGVLPQGPGAYYPPTVLGGVHTGMAAWSEELFGPVASLIAVKDEDEAIAVANATEFGLSASVWTRDLKRGEHIAAEKIQSGACFVNAMSKSDPRMPFGGIKSSGYGRELGEFGIREFVNVHAVWVEA